MYEGGDEARGGGERRGREMRARDEGEREDWRRGVIVVYSYPNHHQRASTKASAHHRRRHHHQRPLLHLRTHYLPGWHPNYNETTVSSPPPPRLPLVSPSSLLGPSFFSIETYLFHLRTTVMKQVPWFTLERAKGHMPSPSRPRPTTLVRRYSQLHFRGRIPSPCLPSLPSPLSPLSPPSLSLK